LIGGNFDLVSSFRLLPFPDVLQDGDVGKVMFSAIEPVCLEKYSEIPQLGRFVIEGKRGATAAGIVLEVKTIVKNLCRQTPSQRFQLR
jgi:sulfate adenylyltransferase subunit 1 (EFTu-like GTPase family)